MTNNKTSEKTRRRLFTRLKKGLPPLRLTQRDIQILNFVYEYRFLTTRQIHALVGGGKRGVTERLSRLFHHGYLDRPLQQLSLRIFGYRHIIYALSRNGAQLLACHYQDEKFLNPRWTENNQAVKAPQFLHTLMISKFRICLSLACRARPDLTLSTWQAPDLSITRYHMEGRKVWLKPDAYFLLSLRDGEKEHRAHFFLECDRGTMTYPNVRRKLAAYWRLRNDRRLIPDWVPRAYRVLTVSLSYQRAEKLLPVAKLADPRRSGSLLFYLCCQSEYGLDQPERLLAPIWRSPADDKLHSLLEGKGARHG